MMMTKQAKYQTKYHSANRDTLFALVQCFSTPFTIKDIENSLARHHINIGNSTIYRIFDDFVAVGILAKNLGPDGATTFRFLEPCTKSDHGYLECQHCHRIFHIDCKHVAKLAKHLSRRHHFEISSTNLTLIGTCPDCQDKA